MSRTKKFIRKPFVRKNWSSKKKRASDTVVSGFAAKRLQAYVRRQLAMNIETKQAVFTSPDGTEIAHNNFITLTSKLLKTTQGVQDPQANNVLCRIGDKVNLRGVSIKMMVELNERYSDVTFRLLVVKCARGDTPTRSTLFSGISGNKMIDTLETERYSVIAQKWFKIKAPNMVPMGDGIVYQTQEVKTGAGVFQPAGGYSNSTLSRATKIVKLWIPGMKFGNKGVLTYENGGEDVKFFDYHVLLYAYSNYSTSQDLWNVGRCNDYVQVMYFKDA